MEKYSRYIDGSKRLLVILNVWHKIIDQKSIPTSVDILVVNEERVVSFSIDEVNYWVTENLIIKIK